MGVLLAVTTAFLHGKADLRRATNDSIANFHLGQHELHCTALTYGLSLLPRTRWGNKFGEESNFDQLVEILLASPLTESRCARIHHAAYMVWILNTFRG